MLSTNLRATEADTGTAAFRTQIRPFLEEFCFDCHGDGARKGNVAFDEFKSDQAALDDRQLWLKALKNLRAGLMPPPRKTQPTAAEKQVVEDWIKSSVFRADPHNPDPGRVTLRRLNRTEYRNTIHDLMGVDFETDKEFPPDDAGFGFDNIADALTLPPMLLEKYFTAAKSIVSTAVPTVPAVPAEQVLLGKAFHANDSDGSTNRSTTGAGGLNLSYYERASVTNMFRAEHAGRFQLLLDFTTTERFVENQFDTNKCRLVFKADEQELFQHEYTREGTKNFHYEFDVNWTAGEHELRLEVHPLTPDAKQVRALSLRLDSVTVRGPLEPEHWVRPKNYERFFASANQKIDRDPPRKQKERARDILERFVEKAYRRPVESTTIDRLVGLAEATYTQPGKTLEAGVSQAMIAVLASPRFLFREEGVAAVAHGPSDGPAVFPDVDEFALASRLSYFLWSSMPDDELFELARRGELRQHLKDQLQRMLADSKSEAFVRNFVGQWLQVRDMDSVQIDARVVLAREAPPDPEQEKRRQRLRELRAKEDKSGLDADEKKELEAVRRRLFRNPLPPPRAELNGDLRRAMRAETEKTFAYILREDRSLRELLDGDYTFLNERLAAHYGLTNLNVKGDEMRLVKLPADSPRGGILTQGAILTVTSNPTRTSPVKRGLFMLDNLLGTPPAPPPPDIPPLEEAAKTIKDRPLTLRETLALHRAQPLCSSCHDRMDPLGLALENFNALGMWRDQERSQPIDATGKLLSGERFARIQELKKILADKHAPEFYRTVTEKMLTYALGRGLEYYDVITVDALVDRLLSADGRPSALLSGIVESAPFQKTRPQPWTETTNASANDARAKEAKTRL